jgi:hypothetical protein
MEGVDPWWQLGSCGSVVGSLGTKEPIRGVTVAILLATQTTSRWASTGHPFWRSGKCIPLPFAFRNLEEHKLFAEVLNEFLS